MPWQLLVRNATDGAYTLPAVETEQTRSSRRAAEDQTARRTIFDFHFHFSISQLPFQSAEVDIENDKWKMTMENRRRSATAPFVDRKLDEPDRSSSFIRLN